MNLNFVSIVSIVDISECLIIDLKFKESTELRVKNCKYKFVFIDNPVNFRSEINVVVISFIKLYTYKYLICNILYINNFLHEWKWENKLPFAELQVERQSIFLCNLYENIILGDAIIPNMSLNTLTVKWKSQLASMS